MLVTIIGQVVGVPLLIRAWGAQVYGEWITLTNTVASIALLNLGVQSYMLNLMIIHYRREEIAEGTRVFHASLRLYTLFCGAALLVVAGLVLWPGLTEWLNIHAISEEHTRAILIVQGLWMTYNLLGGVLMSVLAAINEYPRRLRYSLVDRLLLLGVPLLVAALGGSPFETVLAMAALMIALAVYQVRDVIRRSPFPIGLHQTTWRESRALIRPSLLFLAVRFANTLLTSGIVVVISTAAGGTAVALYSTTMLMTNFIRTIANQGLVILWPEITAAAAEDSVDRLRHWHRFLVKLALLGTLIIGAGLIVFGPDVLRVWLGNQIEIDYVLNALLTYYLILQASTLVSDIFGLATNRQGELFKIDLVTAILTIVSAVALVIPMGVRGAAMALLIGQVWNTVRIAMTALGWTQDTAKPFLADLLGRGWPVIALFLIGPLLIWFIIPGAALRAAALSGVLLGLIALSWWMWFNEDDRVAMMRVFGSVRGMLIRLNPVKG
jgi:O-antigen/teichoic acid export membrane protein